MFLKEAGVSPPSQRLLPTIELPVDYGPTPDVPRTDDVRFGQGGFCTRPDKPPGKRARETVHQTELTGRVWQDCGCLLRSGLQGDLHEGPVIRMGKGVRNAAQIIPAAAAFEEHTVRITEPGDSSLYPVFT